ncbi:flagellar basal-body rod protein FlgG [Gracilibacillus boraciitolerans JCM 21714]|uniref:Flagellar hook protein FlgE n=1 Tax=Gracilibacillus boraciitolerans JCM 21714 TaxID=1298598 RepID=W4VFT2_9BACI|nr:flagellar basal body rod protein FlgG [Gracilibacillus boraciitolerans]GAE91624.1 flagellar basal-body rod protein FlgG [Gracilibacillus boraciitolerans JCM 21714]
MLRSMYAGISGMKAFQTKLDVIGNNIANVNTAGFKKGRAMFQDMMSQQVAGASAPTNIRGGINPAQVGTGAQLGSIDNIHTQGNRQTTSRPLDLQLEGDGMFVFGSGIAQDAGVVDFANTELLFSRAGNLYLDDNNYVVNANGQYLIGQNGLAQNDNAVAGASRIRIPESAQSFSVQGNGVVNYVDENGETQAAGQIMLAKFSNPGGLEKVGSNMYRSSVNDGVFTDDGDAINGLEDIYAPEGNGTASIVAGALEMSNVDLSEEFTEMITAQRGFQANTRIITTSDEILQELVNLKR